MADKEPRRRKKTRRDSQKKDDVRQSEEQFFASLKPEPRESDQEVEEETASHSHHGQPSNLAKVVFVILFSGLVVALSVIFISLRDVDKGPVDIFDMGHGDHHGEEAHDEHLEAAVHDDHHSDPVNEVTIDDFIPGLSSIFSLNNEVLQDVETPEIPSQGEDKVDDNKSPDIELENSLDQGILEEYVEDLSTASIDEPSIVEPLSSELYPETTTSASQVEEDLYSTADYLETEDIPPPLKPDNTDEPEEISPTQSSVEESEEISPTESFVDESEEILPTESLIDIPDDLDTTDVEQEAFSLYEKADITNEFDYVIQDDLDELDDIVMKDPDSYIDDIDVGVENVDNHHIDDEEEEEGVEEEFDFWQF